MSINFKEKSINKKVKKSQSYIEQREKDLMEHRKYLETLSKEEIIRLGEEAEKLLFG